MTALVWPSTETLSIAVPTLIVAYVIFGIAGFGTAPVAAPLLAHVLPVASIVPLLAALDCLAAASMGLKLGDKVDKDELIRIVPLMCSAPWAACSAPCSAAAASSTPCI